jgi:hypothetical protein
MLWNTDPYNSIPRLLRRAIKIAGAEKDARAEVAAAITDVAFELESFGAPKDALAAASMYVPHPIASAVLLRAHLKQLEVFRQQFEEARRDSDATRERILAEVTAALPGDASLESEVLARMVRDRMAALTRYPQES